MGSVAAVRLTEEQRVLVHEAIADLAAKHFRSIDRMRKDYESERRRLEDMLQFGVPQRLPR